MFGTEAKGEKTHAVCILQGEEEYDLFQRGLMQVQANYYHFS